MTLDEILNYYAGLLIIQYRIKPKAKATIKLLVNQAACDGLVQVEQTCFDLDVATGAQLDILGRIVGVPRNIYGLDLVHTYFSLATYDGSSAGNALGRYADIPYSENLFQRYIINAIYALSDFEMRALIKIKIIYNTKYSSLKNIKEALYSFFTGDIDIREDATAMSLIYDITATYKNIGAVAEFLDIFPRPMGVSITRNNL